MKKTSLSRLLLLFLLISCSKEEPNPCLNSTTEIITTPECLKQYLFATGSYWVFQDTSTLVLDSIYITDTNFRELRGPHWFDSDKDPCLKAEGYTIQGIEESGWYHPQITTQGIYYSTFYSAAFFNFCSPPNTSQLLDSLEVGNQMYYDVRSFIGYGPSPSIFYFKENIGLIRYYNPGGITNDLLRYYTIPLF